MHDVKPKLKGGVTMALSAALLAACATVGPNYQRPATALPASYAKAPAGPQAPLKLPVNWWTLYHDATLDQLVAKGLSHSPDILDAVARIEEADATLREAGAALLPEVDATSAGSRARSSTLTTPASPVPLHNDFRLGLNTSFEVDLWGKLRRGVEAVRALDWAARYNRDTVALSLSSLISQTYLNLRALDAQIQVTQAEVADQQHSIDLVLRRNRGGVATGLDLAQAKSSLFAVQGQLADLKRQRSLAENLLGVLVGQPGLAVAAGDLNNLPIPPSPPAGLPSTLLERRPDVQQAEALLMAANARIGVARAAMFPTISLTAGLGGESSALSNILRSGAHIWSLGYGLALPIFDHGRLVARVDEATAQRQEAVAAYQKAANNAFREVSDALVEVQQQQAIEQNANARRDAARQALHLAKVRYTAGYSAFLEVLDAQRTANDAELAAIRARQARLAASVSLMKALGGGWSPALDRTAAR